MAGHLFVTCGDLRHLACDAWLLPTDRSFYVNPAWKPLPPPPRQAPDGWNSGRVRVAASPQAPGTGPAAWWTNTGADSDQSIEWYVAGACDFIRAASAELSGAAPTTRRSKPLLALPLIGTGLGGGARDAGNILRTLLPAIRAAASDHDVDVTLVTRRMKVLSAAQALRRSHTGVFNWPELNTEHVEHAKRLAARAGNGELVLFIGAGVSASAGLPLWGALLDDLACEAGFSQQERIRLRSLPALDRARLLEGRLSAEGGLGSRVVARLETSRHSLSHSLLASLPVREVATTNYDRLFEQASEDAGIGCAVLPYEPSASRHRWLLKLHGCVSVPDDIVLTREDYLRYAERRAALAGIVQALLVTRHMLFVGFGLQDDNFHRIAHDVRSALQGARRDGDSRLGTALQPHDDPFLKELWRKDVRIISFADPGNEADGDATRRLEVFLDLLGMLACTGVDYILDDDYEDALSAEEQDVKRSLRRLAQEMRPAAWASPVGERLRRFLVSLGGGRVLGRRDE